MSGPVLQGRAYWARLAIIVAASGAFWGVPAVAVQATPDPATAFLSTNRTASGVIETASGLQYKILTPGQGDAKPTDQDIALVNYEGRLIDGTSFDKSTQPTPMPVAGVVPGFAEGLKLMARGAKYRFWIKPELGYGSQASGPIPANSVLAFDVEMLDFLPEAVVRQMMEPQQSQAAPSTAAPQP